jgi:hypothetical protein
VAWEGKKGTTLKAQCPLSFQNQVSLIDGIMEK